MATLIRNAVNTSLNSSELASAKLQTKLYMSLVVGAFILSAGVAA